MASASPTERTRPNGKTEVTTALKEAALHLLAERGTSFSIREVAKRANVNHGLVHRHFGTKQDLISAALAERNQALQHQLDVNTSPVDLSDSDGPETAVLLARLILDDATSLIPGHEATGALVRRTARRVQADDPLTAAHRAALANAITLGWTVFGPYLLQAVQTPNTPQLTATLRTIVEQLIEGHPVGESTGG